MRKIDVTYRVWWWPWARTAHGHVPSSWQELNERQFVAAVKAIRGEAITETDYFSTLLGIPTRILLQLDDFQLYQLQQLLMWMDDTKAAASRMIIKKIEGLHAPEDGLDGVTLQQFMTVDTFFGYVTDTMKDGKLEGDEKMLCKFVAALYMKKDESYSVEDVRKTLWDLPGQNIRLVDLSGNATRLLKRADRSLLWCVYINWLFIKAWLSKAFPLLFPEGDDDDGKSARVQDAWLKTFDAFVGNDIAHMDEYREMECMDAFRIMNTRIKESLSKRA